VKAAPPVMPALITPFAADGVIDERAHRSNVTVLRARGVRGFLIGGSTGLGPYLDPGERAVLVGAARDELGDDGFLLGGVAGQAVAQAARQCEELAGAGADAALVLTPTLLLRGNHALVAAFFTAVADRSPLPLFLYTVPAVTGYELPIDTAVDLARHPNIVGMKDSGGDVERIPPILDAVSAFHIYTGASRSVHDATRNGADGAITASSNYAADLVVKARTDAAAQERLTTVSGSVEAYGVPGTYAAAELSGLTPGALRAPLRPLDPASREHVRSLCCPP